MRAGILSILLFFLATKTVFPVPEEQFQKANQLYQEGQFLEAAGIYDGLAKEEPSAEVYYNLGNAYFKSGKLGLAILNYERARKIKPRDRDILANLLYANRLIEYKIDDERNWSVRKLSALLESVTIDESIAVCFLAYFLFILGFLFSLIFKKYPLFGKTGTTAVILVMLCSLPLFLKFIRFGSGKRAIVTEAQAEVRYGPSTSDRIAFRVPEGFEIILDDEKEDWFRIRLRDGRSGWTHQSQVTSI
jgi:hypothetical protein